MCIAPGILSDGTEIPCRVCWQCIENRIKDWEGRCTAENRTAKASHFITLTYGRDDEGNEDHPRAKVLTYSDVQKFFKLLRRHGYPSRYFVVGEYGSERGRCHWHAIVYWLDKVPSFSGYDRRGNWSASHISEGDNKIQFNWQRLNKKGAPVVRNGKPAFWWPHGFAEVEVPGHGSVRYCCTYVMKNLNDAEAQGRLQMSKLPPLGTEYFRWLADRYVEQGLAPTNLLYKFSENRGKDGMPIEYMLRGRAAEMYLDYFVEKWAEVHPGRAMPPSELLYNWLEYGKFKAPAQDVRAEGTLTIEEVLNLRAGKDRWAPPEPPPEKKAKRKRGGFWADENEIAAIIYDEVMTNGTAIQKQFEQVWKEQTEQDRHQRFLAAFAKHQARKRAAETAVWAGKGAEPPNWEGRAY